MTNGSVLESRGTHFPYISLLAVTCCPAPLTVVEKTKEERHDDEASTAPICWPVGLTQRHTATMSMTATIVNDKVATENPVIVIIAERSEKR